MIKKVQLSNPMQDKCERVRDPLLYSLMEYNLDNNNSQELVHQMSSLISSPNSVQLLISYLQSAKYLSQKSLAVTI